jgi:hypothetical protein
MLQASARSVDFCISTKIPEPNGLQLITASNAEGQPIAQGDALSSYLELDVYSGWTITVRGQTTV